ncbi:MAG: hypothetical protein COU33_01220 [Candidatus Magasanikbacteria bacterium CG10_big_fil_rev_8_21_14_0_10_43_6]|uniref:Uncharacterized protein n=1 Tax=Candidatus Magasanikbacteria bacterium CG10_big_fil_rev_8_21_14_0_10_43_6 TaxID=1974650 RepID=A0A2M6W1V4_9BACT|nr:MAG: hypothetical protein COU33_01220 [Candidatus Magasanikbacteria bacterium CG10_big_fil_rev_8_21_14_0_10_43_6]
MGVQKKIQANAALHEAATKAVTESPFVGKTASEEVLSLLKEIKEQNHVISRRITWMVVGNYVRLVVVILPLLVGIILAYVYLPAVFQEMLGEYQSLLGGGTQGAFSITDVLHQISPEQIEEASKLLK